MLADKSLLSATLAATFIAGGLAGYATRDAQGDRPFRANRAEDVYGQRIAALKAEKGYDASELREAIQIHQDYMNDYDRWFEAFLRNDDIRKSTDIADRKFDERSADLEKRVQARRTR